MLCVCSCLFKNLGQIVQSYEKHSKKKILWPWHWATAHCANWIPRCSSSWLWTAMNRQLRELQAEGRLLSVSCASDGGYRWMQWLLEGPSPRLSPTECNTISASQLGLLPTAGHSLVEFPVIMSLLAVESLLTCVMSLFIRLKLYDKCLFFSSIEFPHVCHTGWNNIIHQYLFI